ncbi:MAG: AMP-binding protein [Chloroflexi bacterium]|nr:AMP-binding protein [Chloroflexota bacterium]
MSNVLQNWPITDQAFGEFLATAADRYGDRPALLIKPGFRTRITTYRGLERGALRVGRYLQARGIGKGDRVLLWAPNMPEWVQVFFGCQKVGAVVVPLDVRSAPDFVETIVEKTRPKLAVLSRSTVQHAGSVNVPVAHLEQLEIDLPNEAELLERVEVEPDEIAEIMFTSGTTGDPKGVMLTHRNVLFNVLGAHDVLTIRPDFRLLSLLPLSHMLEQSLGLFTPLSGGASIAYPISRQPSVLFRTIAENRVSMLVVVPQALQLFVNAIEREARRQGREAQIQRLFGFAERLPMPLRRLAFRSVHQKFGGGLDVVISGGAYLDPALAHKWQLMGVQVLQGYGATEAAPVISCDRPGRAKTGAVGTAFPGVDLLIAPDGEILAKGPNVFGGYWDNPEATARALEDGWYHTGDLGSLDQDGYVHLKGRKKDLIVLANGQNVYPEDIESRLIQQPAVEDGVVVGLSRPNGAIEVHAVLLMRDPSVAGDAVRQANGHLADHQQVQGFTVWPLDDFPRTHTLKVKKHEVIDFLLNQETIDVSSQSAVQTKAPDDPLFRLIAELASVPASQVTAERTLGGDLNLDSLSRVELLSAVEGELGAYVDEANVTPNTTVAELRRLVEASQSRSADNTFKSWPLGLIGSVARELFVQLIVFPAYHLFWRVRSTGLEHVADLHEPALIAANHNFGVGTIGLDPAAAWMGLPRALRLRTCTAGEEHAVFDQPIKGFLARLLNAFPLSREGNVRGSLEYIGKLLDLGWSVLIFPEGKLTVDGPMQPFMGGTGLIAVESRTPVVPMYIEVERKGIVEGSRGPWRGAFAIHLGKTLRFAPGTSYAAATQQIEDAVRALAPAGARTEREKRDSNLQETGIRGTGA